jgi:hypothetical protein
MSVSKGDRPSKKNSMDILDQYLDHDDDVHAVEIEAQTAALQIYRKANKLKTKIKAIQLASRLTKSKKDEEEKKPATEVFKQPPCLVLMMSKINKERKDRKEIPSAETNKYVKLETAVQRRLFDRFTL